MALDAGNLKIYCRGVDLSIALQSTSLEQSREEQDETAYADAIRKMTPTLGRVSVAHAGVYSDGAFTIGEVFRQASTTDDEGITLAPEGATAGNKGFIVLAHKASITMPGEVAPGSIHKAALRGSSRYPLVDGVIGFNGAVSNNSQTAAYQLGALAAGQKIVATVHLLALSGSPSATFILESDNAVGFPSGIAQDTSAAQTARGSVVLQEATVVSDDWWRVRWTFSGTGNFTAVIALGLAAA
jgi:hypothetical protein